MPSPKGITLWTRVSDLTKSAKLDPRGRHRQELPQGRRHAAVKADSKRDFTVHAPVKGLKPATEYFYRFDTGDKSSQGRALPHAARRRTRRTPVKIGIFSCQDYEAGYYNAHAAHRQGEGPRPGPLPRRLHLRAQVLRRARRPRRHDGRQRRRQRPDARRVPRRSTGSCQSDKNLQAMHAAHPFVSVWDDHEVEDNYAGDEQDSARAGSSAREQRRARAGCRSASGARTATRRSSRRCRGCTKKGDPTAIYGSLKLGGIAELFLTDQRQYRDPQPCSDVHAPGLPRRRRRRAARCSAPPRRSGSRAPLPSRRPPGSSGAAR